MEKTLASLSVRKLDEATLARLRIRAAHHGVSMEEEVRRILVMGLRKELGRPMSVTDGQIAAVAPVERPGSCDTQCQRLRGVRRRFDQSLPHLAVKRGLAHPRTEARAFCRRHSGQDEER